MTEALTRHSDWPERLSAYIQARLRVPFGWGSNDCCLFAADAVHTTTGHDFAAAERGSYDTALGAARVLAGRSPADLATASLGEPMTSPALAQRGDLVLYEHDGQQTLGVCVGEFWCAPGDVGLAFRPMASATLAWRV